MIWLSWRQFCTQAVVGAAALAALAIYLVVLGTQTRCGYTGDIVHVFQTRFYVLDGLIVVLPGMLGMFWGAPLVACVRLGSVSDQDNNDAQPAATKTIRQTPATRPSTPISLSSMDCGSRRCCKTNRLLY